MKAKNISNYIDKIAWTIICIMVVAFLGVQIYVTISGKVPKLEITFNITGINNESLNASSLTSLHFDCIKFCATQFYDEYGSRNDCWAQCASLGREATQGMKFIVRPVDNVDNWFPEISNTTPRRYSYCENTTNCIPIVPVDTTWKVEEKK